jgi:signal transduction histidine kinase
VRRRITVAILGVVVGTLVLTVAGSLLLVHGAAISTAQNEITTEAEAIGTLMMEAPRFTGLSQVDALRRIGAFDRLTLVGFDPLGDLRRIPPPLEPSVLDASALRAGQTVTGNVGNVVFVARPIFLPGVGEAVLIATRRVTSPVNGVAYFALVAGVVLLAGAAVAAFLARRISAPLVRAVHTTRQIAAGNLAATVPVDRREVLELTELANAINTLGTNLSRAQGLEREFLLSVSHELRTPLTSIRGYADAVAEGATEDVTGALSIIGSEARRLERLVQDLLDLARLHARQFSLHPRRVDCASVLSAAAEELRPEAESGGVVLQTADAQQHDLWVDADPDRLGQIVSNLVENALKFARRRVEIGAGRVGGSVGLWVTDDGPGVSAQDLPHIFERHFRSDRVTGRKAGAGLGLAIVAELAAAMGGTVDAQSPVDGAPGTRMVLWLRAAPGVGMDTTPAAAPGPDGDTAHGAAPGPGGPASTPPLHPPV